MARRCGRATSRFTGELQEATSPRRTAVPVAWLCLCVLFPAVTEAGLYTSSDLVSLVTPENVQALLVNSSAATVVEFYASWCGHCIAFSPVYTSLARDIKEWKPALNLAAIDCAPEENRKICTDYKIKGYPTIKFFPAYSKSDFTGLAFTGFPRDIRGLRHKVIDKLETHEEPWPPACPPLEPTSQAEIDSFFDNNNVQHLALIFEDSQSYIGREVTLDLLQFENIAVRRVLQTEDGLVTKLEVTEFPSCYLYYPGGIFTRLKVNIEARTFYSYALQRLPGVVRSGRLPLPSPRSFENSTEEPWRTFNRSRIYMADLESALHYSLRVELSAETVIKGKALKALTKYVSVLVKYFPGRPLVMNLLKSVKSWLEGQTAKEISYEALREILDNTAQTPDAALPHGVKWVGCQGSQPYLRGYPCGVWTLFHVLTVQAKTLGGSDPQEVLNSMRSYVQNFFGCRPCAEHFDNMAAESLGEVNTMAKAVQWLWSRHNRVNNRIAGELSEDPQFPKIQWPSPELCPACHTVSNTGEHRWDKAEILPFLLFHFNSSRILSDYLDDESHILEKQREKHLELALAAEKHLERKAREASDSNMQPPPTQATTPQEEEEEQEEGPPDEEEEEGGEGAPVAAREEEQEENRQPASWMDSERAVGGVRRWVHRRPSFVGLRMRELQEDIVDLDSFVNQHYKAKALQLAASSRVKQRTLQRQKEPERRPVFGLGMELDAGVGMMGLEPMEDDDFRLDPEQRKNRLRKRELSGQVFDWEAELSHKGRWISALSIEFSKLDISLCVILYFLSSMCLLAMYLFFKMRFRLRRVKASLP